MRVGIMGASLGTGNRGVSALGASLVKLVCQASDAAEPVMLIGSNRPTPVNVWVDGSPRTVPITNFRLSTKARLREHLAWIAFLALLYRFVPISACRRLLRRNPWIGTVAEASMVGDIRGGDSFSDIYGLRNFLLASLPVLTVIWIRGRIVLFPQTYGPFKHRAARALARYILRHAAPILSRDHESIETVRKLVGSEINVEFCPDVAFALDPIAPQAVSFTPPLPPKRGQTRVGINVNGLMFNGGYTRENMFGLKLNYPAYVTGLINAVLADPQMQVVLVPHTFAAADDVESDPEACNRARETIPDDQRQRVHLISGEYDQHEIKAIIGDCDFFIGSRMHSCIAALSQGIPTIGVAYSKKFHGVFASVGAKSWVIDARSVETETAVRRTIHHLGSRAEMRTQLGERPDEIRGEIRTKFAAMFAKNQAPLLTESTAS